ncbi:MAG: hypothetical protein ACE5FI_14085 [Anaerolineales bacterium]
MSFSIGAGGDLTSAMEQLKSAAKDVRRELADIRKQEQEVKRAGGALTSEQQARKQNLIQRQDQIKTQLAVQRESQKAQREAASKARTAARQKAARLSKFRAGIYAPTRLLGGVGPGDIEGLLSRLGGGLGRAGGALAAQARSSIARRAGAAIAASGESIAGAAGSLGLIGAAGAALGFMAKGLAQSYGQDTLAAARDNAATERQFLQLARSDRYGTRYSTEFQRQAKARVNAAADRAREAMRRSSATETLRSIVGLAPSKEATAAAVRAESVEFRRRMQIRRWGANYAKFTSADTSAANPWIRRRVRELMHSDYGYISDLWDAATFGRYSARFVEQARTEWQELREKQWQRQLRENDVTRPEHRDYPQYVAAKLENQIHIEAVARDQYERSMQWNQY